MPRKAKSETVAIEQDIQNVAKTEKNVVKHSGEFGTVIIVKEYSIVVADRFGNGIVKNGKFNVHVGDSIEI